MKSLPPPDGAIENQEAVELLRGWVIGEDLQVSIAFEAFGGHIEIWGQLLAETVTHIADALSGEGHGEQQDLYVRLRDTLLKHLDNPRPGLTGTTQEPVQ
jgi:hypothetical protein